MVVDIVTEDELGEVLLRKVLAECANLTIGTVRVTNGFGQIKKNLKAFNNLARVRPVLVLADQDTASCAPALIENWFQNLVREPGLIFRVATREVESWVMADRSRFARFLGVQTNLVPAYPDQLADPKATLVELASSSNSRTIRKALVPAGVTAKIGPEYNAVLSEFVLQNWDPNTAKSNSESLRRAIAAVKSMEV